MRGWLRWPGWLLIAVLVALAARLIVEPAWLPVLLFIAALWGLATVLRQGRPATATAWLHRLAMLPALAVYQPPADFVHARRYRGRHPARDGGWGRRAVAWLLPLLLGAIFVGLFAIANPIIDDWTRRAATQAWNWFANLAEYLPASRIGLWLLVAVISWTLLRGRVRRRARARRVPPVVSSPPSPIASLRERFGEPSFVARCLLVFNIVFAVQTALDARYLFGGAVLPAGMTYASYAHRGAYPLIAAALLAGAFVMIAFRAGGAAESAPAPRRLVTLWLIQCVFLTGTAAWRLWLYVDQYGLTRWRVSTAIWMLLVALGLAAIAWRIVGRRSNDWLVGAVSLATATVLAAACVPAWDAWIADHNVRHCREVDGRAQPLDLAYLRDLGPSSIPALRWLAQHSGDAAISREATVAADGLSEELAESLGNWRGWTVRRSALARGEG